MLFGMWTRVGPRNHVLDGDPDPQGQSAVRCAKSAEPIDIGMLSKLGQGNHRPIVNGVQIPHAKPKWGNFEGEKGRHIVYRLSAVSCAKPTEWIKMPFRMWRWIQESVC